MQEKSIHPKIIKRIIEQGKLNSVFLRVCVVEILIHRIFLMNMFVLLLIYFTIHIHITGRGSNCSFR
jgi:hypothetical protein